MTAEMKCPKCPETMEVSEEDPDATQSEMFHHINARHAGYNWDETYRLLAKVTVTE